MKTKLAASKGFLLLFLCLLSPVFFQAESNATEYLRADFSVGYTNGANLVGQKGWGQVGTTGTNGPIQVTNNTVYLKGVSTPQSAYLNFTNPLNVTNTNGTNAFYYVFDNFTVKEAFGSASGTGSGVACLTSVTNGSGANFARLYIRKSGGTTTATNFDLGISSGGSGTNFGTNSFAKNTSYKVVVAYTANFSGLDKTTVYVNPTGSNPADWTNEVSQTNTTDPGVTLKSFVLQQGAIGSGQNEFTLSRILVTDSVSDVTPPTFSYSPSSITGNVGIPISPNMPTSSGELFTRFSIDRSLPSGLAFNADTGEVSGTPTASSPSSTYTITGSNSSGTMTATNQFSITIQPPLIVYPLFTIHGTIGTFLSILPTTNGVITNVIISPALPSGLTPNPFTGQISGTPLSLTSTTHTITAEGLAGSYSTQISLQINPLIQTFGEEVTTINDTSGSISTLQAAIDTANNARTNPSNFIIINLKPGATYQVTSNPLTLGSKMCLSGASNTSIAASNSATATCLIKISNGASYTSVNFLTLNGNQAPLYGIEATEVNRVNLDQLIIRKTGKDGIFMQGLGAGTFDNEVTVTRCEVSEATTAAGIHLSDTTQAVCLDNLCYNNAYGILLESSAHAALVNNQAKFNTASGISLTNSSSNKITRNFCQGNGTGLSIAGETNSNQRNVFVLNEILSSPTGISLGGVANVLYDNLISSNVTSHLVLRTGYEAGVNRIISTTSSFSNTGTQEYFYPPTINNPHSEAIIRHEKGRTNIETPATSMSEIQNDYNDAQTKNTNNNVIVLKLTAPEITGDATLRLTSNTCVLIDGIIKLNPGVTAFSSLSNSYISISGGTIDGQNFPQPRNGLVFSNCSRILIKEMSLINFGDKTTRTNSDVIAFKGNGNPSIVSDCTINGGSGRGIWTLGNNGGSASGFIFNSNSISNVNMDGIDLDTTTSASLAIDNTCSDNIRNGIFTEEGANLNHIIRNICTSNDIGINVYSKDNRNTVRNAFIGNTCYNNGRGLRFGSAAPLYTSQNFAFNNQISHSSRSGIDAQNTGSENYISQSILLNNTAPLESIASAIFFNSPASSFPFTSDTGYLDWQQSFGWSASASLPYADPNGNGVPNLLEYALALDPLSTTPPKLPSVEWDTSSPNGPWLTFTCRRNKSATDLTYEVWSSTDLKNWTLQNADGVNVFVETASTDVDGNGKVDLLRARIKPGSNESKRFLRLQVRKN